MDTNIKDFNKVIANYDNMLAVANRQVIILSTVNQELLEEIEELKAKLEEKK